MATPAPFDAGQSVRKRALSRSSSNADQLDPVPMKITDPHHSTRAFLNEEGAAQRGQ